MINYLVNVINLFLICFSYNGVAHFREIRQQKAYLQIHVETLKNGVTLRSSFDDENRKIVEWRITSLPVKMGRNTCSSYNIGECFQCYDIESENLGHPPEAKCLRGSSITKYPTSLTMCKLLKNTENLIGRTIVITISNPSLSNVNAKSTHCATIEIETQYAITTMSTITYLQHPYAGYIAFRKLTSENGYKSEIIGNVTLVNTSSSIASKHVKWEILDENDKIYSSKEFRQRETYTNECKRDQPMSCPEGDLWRKHEDLRFESRKSNLFMYNDMTLKSEALSGKKLRFYYVEMNVEYNISITKIEDLSPINIDVRFLDGSTLSMLQRDPWSHVTHTFAHVGAKKTFTVNVYQTPSLNIRTGEMWDCNLRWSNEKYLPSFETAYKTAILNESYTLFWSGSMMYRGVSVSDSSKTLCSTFTYTGVEEKMVYSKLNASETKRNSGKDQAYILIMIEPRNLRQTTMMMATICQELTEKFFLSIKNDDKCAAVEDYNPFKVCPATCSPSKYCATECVETCCSMCSYHSGSLCPLGDLKNRFGFFQQAKKSSLASNEESAFTVMTGVDMDVDLLRDKYAGLKVIVNWGDSRLVRCGKVEELETIEVEIPLGEGRLVLSQKAAWHPITVSWENVRNIGLKFWKIRIIESGWCTNEYQKSNPDNEEAEYKEIGPFSPTSLPISRKSAKSLSFFGKNSILYKSLTVTYTTTSGTKSSKTVMIQPRHNNTVVLESKYEEDDKVMYKFVFTQRQNHLSEETYIRVDFTHSKYCSKKGDSGMELKWYLINKEYAKTLKPGTKFIPESYDDKRFYHKQTECFYQPPYNYKGDFSGEFGDINVGSDGKTFRHDSLPLLQGVKSTDVSLLKSLTDAEGHYLLLCYNNDTIMANLELKRVSSSASDLNTASPKTNTDKQEFGLAGYIAIVVVGVLVIVTVLCVVYFKRKDRDSNSASNNYDAVPHQQNAQSCVAYNVRSKNLVSVLKPISRYTPMYETVDINTGVKSIAHFQDLAPPIANDFASNGAVQPWNGVNSDVENHYSQTISHNTNSPRSPGSPTSSYTDSSEGTV